MFRKHESSGVRTSFNAYLNIIAVACITITGLNVLGYGTADSLLIELGKTQDDSAQVNILSKLYMEYRRSDTDRAVQYAEKALEISRTSNNSRGIANSLYHIGMVASFTGDYTKALDLLEEAKSYYNKVNDTANLAACLTEIGNVSGKQNNHKLALECYNKVWELMLLTGNKPQLSRIYHKLGGVYNEQEQYDKALEYHQKSLAINLDLDFKLGISVNYNNIGNVYFDLNQFAKARENYLKALKIKKELNDKKGIASTLNNIGLIFLKQKEFDKAIAYHEQALEAFGELNSKSGMAMCEVNLANDYLAAGRMDKAIDYAKKSLKLSEEINSLQLQTESHQILSGAFAGQKQFEKAWRHHQLFKEYYDSTVNIEVVRQITEMESKFEMEKKEKEIALLNAEKEKQDLQIQKQQSQRKLMIAFVLLVFVVMLFLYWGYRNKQQLNKKLRELNFSKSRFFANISHEFRTPLTLLLGPLEKLLNNPKQEDKEMISLMHRNATRLLFLDNQLLDLAKLESGKLGLKVHNSDIVPALKGMAMSFESFAKRQGISFQCDFPEETFDAYFDKDKLEKIVYNLLSNAFKFTPEKGKVVFEISIISDKKKLPHQLKAKAGKTICICVSDTGPGIAKAHQANIFDRFYQVEAAHKKVTEGSGLGLSLTKELVELHRSLIKFENAKGSGSIFKVYLPIDKKSFKTNEIIEDLPQTKSNAAYTDNHFDTSDSVTECLSADDGIAQAEEELLQILIVEDNRDMRSYISDCFQGKYIILEAEDGAAGLRMATDRSPDIIITDLTMPGMDGIELCRKLKTDERSSHIPVVLLTAHARVEDRIAGLEMGADDYIAKPFNREELLIRVQNLTKQRKLLRERFAKEIKIQAKDITVTSADERFLNKLISFIETNISNPDLNVDSLLEEIHLNMLTLKQPPFCLLHPNL